VRTHHALFVALFFAITTSRTALADEKDPRVEACTGKSEGAPCAAKKPVKEEGKDLRFVDEPGTCQSEQCCELDYSGGSPPKSVCAPCLSCKPGGPALPKSDGGESGGPEVEPPSASAGDEPPATAPGKKGCALGGGASWFGLLGLAIAGRARARARARARG
jgi:hypothetical protein